MLKIISFASATVGTVFLSHYESNCRDKTFHPGRRPGAKLWDDNWDMMKPDYDANMSDDEKKAITPKAVRHIYLVRHGQYHLKEVESEKRKLTDLGRKQAEKTGERLGKLLGSSITHFYISTVTRARETGDIIIDTLKPEPGCTIQHTDLLKEGAPIEPVPAPTEWKPESWQFHQDGARIEAGYRALIHRSLPSQEEDSHEVLVCHGNVIRYFVCRALQYEAEGWLRMSLANGSITHLVIKPNGNVSLRGLGEKGHLPVDLITYN